MGFQSTVALVVARADDPTFNGLRASRGRSQAQHQQRADDNLTRHRRAPFDAQLQNHLNPCKKNDATCEMAHAPGHSKACESIVPTTAVTVSPSTIARIESSDRSPFTA